MLSKSSRFILLVLLCLSGALVTAQDAVPSPTPVFPQGAWLTSLPQDHGFAASLDDDLQTYLEDHEMGFLSSALLVHDGEIILEYYRDDVNRNTLHLTRSVTKSIMATLVGIALDEGLLPDLEVTLDESLPTYYQADTYRDTADITLKNLLMMRSGLGWSDSLERIAQIETDPDPIAWILSFKQAAPPDSYWNYSTADAHLAGIVLQQWLGEEMASYAEEKLFDPIGITRYEWATDQLGYNLGGADMKLTTRDMARFGYLLLNRGQWEGQTVVPESWVNTMTTPQADPAYYGYSWWLMTAQNDGINVWRAVGYGGQNVMVLPDDNLVFVTTSDWEVDAEVADQQARKITELLLNFVLTSREATTE